MEDEEIIEKAKNKDIAITFYDAVYERVIKEAIVLARADGKRVGFLEAIQKIEEKTWQQDIGAGIVVMISKKDFEEIKKEGNRND